jgi:hypothetical protein
MTVGLQKGICSRFNLKVIVLVLVHVLVLEIRILWVASDEYEHEVDDEVIALKPHMELYENNIGFSKFHRSTAAGFFSGQGQCRHLI